MKKIDNDFKYKIIGVITLLIFLIIGIITSNNFKNNSKKIILSSRKIAVGYVIKIYTDRYNKKLVYEFNYHDKKYRSTTGTNTPMNLESQVIKRTWPVIFSENQPEYCEILITKKDFERFNLQKPDSLINFD